MLKYAFVLCALVVCAAQAAEPIRSDKAFAIYPQVTPEDWTSLIASGNLAAGVTVDPAQAPNNHNTGSDMANLTDGVLAGYQGRMWSDKRAVGWSYQPYARVTLDLGESKPIGQVLMRLQIINKDHTLPRTITVSLSNDGDAYSQVRNLSAQTHPEDDPARTYEPMPFDPPGIYAVVMDLNYEARYVRIDFALHGTMVTDEIAITPAAGAVQQLPPPVTFDREYLDNVFDRRDQYRRMTAAGNLLLGKPVQYAPTPTQYLTVDDEDPLQLTDGKFGERTDERIWFERGCVGWHGPPVATIFADLEQVQPIDSVVIRLLGGGEQNALRFPDEITVLLSDNGEDYYHVAARHRRGLDDLSDEAWDLPEEKLAWVHNFRIPVERKGRYVALQLRYVKQCFVSDEMAIVKGTDDLPAFEPDPTKKVVIVTEGVAFTPVWGNVPVCENMPLRARLLIQDARVGAEYGKPCKLVLDLPETVQLTTPDLPSVDVEHDGRPFKRYTIVWRGLGTEYFLQSLLPAGETDVLYTYGDSGAGLMNERKLTWEALYIPPARVPERLHVSLSWADAPSLHKNWPGYLDAQHHLGFNAVGMRPYWWRQENVPGYQESLRAIRAAGFDLIQIESPAGAASLADRKQPEIKSILPGDAEGHTCPAYRGQYYQKEHAGFAQHAVWIEPDVIFYDIEAYWYGAVESPKCERCLERFAAGDYADWDAFHAAMGHEIHVDIRNKIDAALAEAGITRKPIYGSYRTEPSTRLNDGLFAFEDAYPEMLQMAMPSLYVAGNAQAVADYVAANRAAMDSNNIVPWLTTGCYGEFDPVRTRDSILEVFANGGNGITYYWYGYFDAAHFKYHAEAVDIVAPIEDIFMDGKPLTGLSCSDETVKVCGMGLDNDAAVLVSNYHGVDAGTTVTVQTSAKAGTPVWDLHAGEQVGKTDASGAFTVALTDVDARMYYIGTTYGANVPR
jgi:hypothetical protein